MAGPVEQKWHRLTPFEEYMLADDRHDWPMTFWVRLKFSEPLDATRLSQAMSVTSSRHPLLAARIVRDRRGRPHWAAAEPMGIVRILPLSGAADRMPFAEHLDLTDEPAWRIWADASSGNRQLWVEFHHSACDGMGALRAIDDLLQNYAAGGSCTSGAAKITWNQLAERGRCGLLSGSRKRVGQWICMIRRIFEYGISQPVSLETHEPQGSSEFNAASDSPDGNVICELGDLAEISAAAHRHHCTITDLLISCLFRATRDLLDERPSERNGLIRFFIPMDLRGDPRNPCEVCNIVGMLHIDRNSGKGRDESFGISSIARETSVYRRYKAGRSFVVALTAVRRLLGSFRLVASPNHCFATSVLTNLKSLFRSSPLASTDGLLRMERNVLEAIDFFPPVRPKTPVCFALYSYAGQLRLSLRFRTDVFSRDAAEFVSNRVSSQLREFQIGDECKVTSDESGKNCSTR